MAAAGLLHTHTPLGCLSDARPRRVSVLSPALAAFCQARNSAALLLAQRGAAAGPWATQLGVLGAGLSAAVDSAAGYALQPGWADTG